MKLRNKITGELEEVEIIKIDIKHEKIIGIVTHEDGVQCKFSYPMYRFKAEWEDAPEEPKNEIYWFIDAYGNIVQNKVTKHYGDRYTDMSYDYERQKQIGNRFESEEEAIKARDKLLARQRIKEDLVSLHWQDEKDGKFSVWGQFYGNMLENDAILNIHRKDLDLLFGGEE